MKRLFLSVVVAVVLLDVAVADAAGCRGGRCLRRRPIRRVVEVAFWRARNL